MISKESKIHINCNTKEEQNMMLDIFEMLGIRWRGGENPRGYASFSTPMYYYLDDERISQGSGLTTSRNSIVASELRNQWISLKIKKEK